VSNFNTKETKTLNYLIQRLSSDIEYDEALIRKAYEFIKKCHADSKRMSGGSIVEHCLSTAGYVADLNLDTTSIVSALLHDVVDKTEVSIEEIDAKFGTEIAFIVDGLTSIRALSKNYNEKSDDKDNFKKLIFNSTEDLRVIIIRLCEKLHNVLSIKSLPDDLREQSARKILNIYAPLAEYLGLGVIQRELTDRAFEIIKPKQYKLIHNAIEDFFDVKGDVIESFESDISDFISQYIKNFKIHSRKKSVYSAYNKLKRKYLSQGLTLDDAIKKLMDIYASRILVENVEQCYLVLGLIHETYDVLADEFVDYMANPKENGYKSIHVLFKYKGVTLELQIRTFEMEEYNEFGPACHIAYKLSGGKKNNDSFTWTKELVGWQDKNTLSKDDFRIKAFKESVFCFTPKGLVVTVQKGAGPLDFAFKVHTDLGIKYRGALVNGKMVSKDYELKTGDTVEILTDKNPNVTRDWLKVVKSTAAKAQIRKNLKRAKK